MDWWNELWLNEGFATWVGWLAVDHFYPGKDTTFFTDCISHSSNIVIQSGTYGPSLSYAIPEVIMQFVQEEINSFPG